MNKGAKSKREPREWTTESKDNQPTSFGGTTVAVDGSVERLRVCGKRKENSGTKDVLGVRQAIVLVETLEQKVKYVISAGRLLLSGTLIGFPEESEKVSPIRFDTWKKEREIDWAAVSASRSADPYSHRNKPRRKSRNLNRYYRRQEWKYCYY